MLEEWQQKQEYLSLDELIWYIYESTNYYDFVNSKPDGELKTANLKLLFEKAKDYERASFKGLYNFINYIDKISKTSRDMGSAKLIGENENVIRIMSIHKSKGLEFPVVFLCETGKKFNFKDLNETILLHQDMGFGLKYINYERKIEYNTLAKEAIKVKNTNEILSEEMRLLYVALTRAKEKLIITGCDKNLENPFKFNNKKIDIGSIKKSKCYLDWIELVYLNNMNKLDNILHVNIINKSKIDTEKNYEEKTSNDFIALNIDNKELNEKVDKILSWKYPYIKDTKMEGKASVTEIAKGKKKKLIDIIQKPKFISNTENLNKAEIGTLMHLILQKLDFKLEYNEEELRNLIYKLVLANIITENQVKYIDIKKILKFTKSILYIDIKNAKEIHKEEPFYIYLPANELYKNETDEKILIQGIIDLYYINKNDELVLVDYKTDYVLNEDGQELTVKYKKQLEIYKQALEKSLNRKVDKTYIYSLYLNKEICV